MAYRFDDHKPLSELVLVCCQFRESLIEIQILVLTKFILKIYGLQYGVHFCVILNVFLRFSSYCNFLSDNRE